MVAAITEMTPQHFNNNEEFKGGDMKVYKLEIYVPDFDQLGPEEIKDVIENTRYPNHCINPDVIEIKVCDIGEWDDESPLNKKATFEAEYKKVKMGLK